MRNALPALFVVLWATGFIGARLAMPHAEPFTFLTVRFVTAALLFAAALPLTRRRRTMNVSAMAHSALAGAFLHGIYLGGVFWAVRHGMPAGLSALLVGLQPLLTALLALVMLGERVSRRQWAALAVGLVGVALVLWPKLTLAGAGVTPATIGACAVAVAAMSFGTVWQKRHVSGGDLAATTMLQYVGAAAVTGVAAVASESGRVDLTGELAFAMAWLVLVLSVGAILLLMVLIERGAVADVASLFYLVPAVTALIAFALFGEALTAIQLVGMAVTAAAVAAATRRAGDE